jgi:AcrR family transcriptional regulator
MDHCMNSPIPYQRARSAEQKEERRRHLLATARDMLRQSPAALDLGINELARQAQMTKSNVYRYFESSEAVLMDLLVEEYAGWHAELSTALARGKAGSSVEHIARVFASTISGRPLLCRLTSILPSILERKVSFERMVDFKGNLLAIRQRAAQDFHARVPDMAQGAFEQVVKHALPLIIGLWPLSNPAEMAAQVIELPGLESLRYDFEQDLEHALLTLMRGMAQS